MTRPNPSARRRTTAAAAGLVGLVASAVLGGCSIADSQPAPGTAAKVEDVSISVRDVDDAVTDVCSYFASSGTDVQITSRQEARRIVVGQLVRRAAVEQLLDEADVDIRSQYTQTLAEIDSVLRDQLADATDDQAAALRLTEEANAFTTNGLISLGEQLLREEGETSPDETAASDRGEQALAAWLLEHDVEINPQFQLTVDETGSLVDETSEISVPVAADDQEADSESLPTDQRCG